MVDVPVHASIYASVDGPAAQADVIVTHVRVGEARISPQVVRPDIEDSPAKPVTAIGPGSGAPQRGGQRRR